MIIVGYKVLILGILLSIIGAFGWILFVTHSGFELIWWKLLTSVLLAAFTGIGLGLISVHFIAKKNKNWFKERDGTGRYEKN